MRIQGRRARKDGYQNPTFGRPRRCLPATASLDQQAPRRTHLEAFLPQEQAMRCPGRTLVSIIYLGKTGRPRVASAKGTMPTQRLQVLHLRNATQSASQKTLQSGNSECTNKGRRGSSRDYSRAKQEGESKVHIKVTSRPIRGRAQVISIRRSIAQCFWISDSHHAQMSDRAWLSS